MKVRDTSPSDKILYNYGDSGLVGFTLNGTEYFYIRNAQSDIIGIIDSNGKQVVSYTYDTWGKLISITGDKALGEKNLYRYRGYRYDNETGYYYLQSRYYNPEIGKFINADALGGNVGALLSHNIFAYCNNNPVNAKDTNGFRPIYTQGEETSAMREASYRAMNKVAKARIQASYNAMAKMSSNTGKPNSHEVKYKNGNIHQERWYGPDGKAIKDRHHNFVYFANIKAYPDNNYSDNINCYDDFLNSNCELVILCSDGIYYEIYSKSEEMIRIIKSNCIKKGFDEIEYITDENDCRTIFSVE
jgi:RHS repeat-associated protein